MKIRVLVATAFSMLVASAGFAPVATAEDTTATFEIAGGGLAISVPASTVALTTISSGAASASGQLGPVTVTDTRGALVATWMAMVSSTTFTTGTATTHETVSQADISYASGLPTSLDGVGTFVPQLGAALGTSQTAAEWTVGTGNNSATWNPTLTFTLSSTQVAGTYTGTVTHSVA